MSAPPTVLIVDDDTDLRTTVAEALEEGGYHVAAAANGRDALQMLLRGDRPDLILLDMMMPEMDGWTFRAEQHRNPEIASIPVLIFTAYGTPRETAEALGVRGFLKKPLRLDELLAMVERILEASATDGD